MGGQSHRGTEERTSADCASPPAAADGSACLVHNTLLNHGAATALRIAFTVASALKSRFCGRHSIVFLAGARLTPLLSNFRAATRCFMRTVAGSTTIIWAVIAKSSCSPSGVCLTPSDSSHLPTPE